MLVEVDDGKFVNPDNIIFAYLSSGFLSLEMSNEIVVKTKFKNNNEFTDACLSKGNDDLVKARILVQETLNKQGE